MNISTRERNSKYFDTSLAIAPKSDVPQYCNNNVVTLMGLKFNCEHGICTNMRRVDTICATGTISSPFLNLYRWKY